jgi:hypothetical protein
MTSREQIAALVAWTRAIAARFRGDERGSVTETVIIVAIFAALALAVGAIIVMKVTDKANSIPTQ